MLEIWRVSAPAALVSQTHSSWTKLLANGDTAQTAYMAAQFSASLALGRSLGGSKNSLKSALNVSGECQPPEEYHKGQQSLGMGARSW